MDQKKCVLFVVDALMESIVRGWISKGRLPNIEKLIQSGGTLSPCTSIFPSITPAATCSIATGCYPREHGVEGASWFNPVTNRAEYFGDDRQLILQEGLHQYVVDFGDRMNFELLQKPLVYEYLHEASIESACLNYMWFRGPNVHSRVTPLGLRLLAGKLVPDVRGPKILKLGDFVHSFPDAVQDIPVPQTGIFQRYGFHDETTAACALALAKQDCLPPFTLAYFPMNDDHAHNSGLEVAAEVCVERFDAFLGEFVVTVGGWDVIDDQYSILIVGDHGQTEPDGQSPRVVRLDLALDQYNQGNTAVGLDQSNDETLVICPNMRAAAIYLRTDRQAERDRVVETLLAQSGVDQVIYDERVAAEWAGREQAGGGLGMFTVRTADRGQMSFSKAANTGGDRGANAIDGYGNRWRVHGELSALDLQFADDGTLQEGAYPNALERIYGAFTGLHSPIWVTARPGAELAIAETQVHDGGSHGSLYRDDSMAALITSANVDRSQLPNPQNPRIVDVLPLVLGNFGLAAEELQADQQWDHQHAVIS